MSQVAAAHAATFRWIFEEGNSTGFAEWLRKGVGVYWIQGKPASGKSTLMRYITYEPRLKRLSKEWAGKRRLVISSFWFWAAGSKLQQSLVGLYRTLLYQVLKKEPGICRIAFPEWQIKFSDEEPTLETLTRAMDRVVKDGVLSVHHLFIIDGLDEYHRDNIGKTQLVEIFLGMAKCPNIKLLLASRPEIPFVTGFRHYPNLRLEVLTVPDIQAYIDARLWSNPALRDITESETTEVQQIADFVAENAQGVFLWVVLVLNIFQAGLNDYDSFAEIRTSITRLPQELEVLFKHILEVRTPPKHRVENCRYLLLALKWQQLTNSVGIPAVTLAIAQNASDYKEACRLVELPVSDISLHERHLARRLGSRCNGLLEYRWNSIISFSDTHVTFLHRTLLDYLLEQHIDSQTGRSMLLSGVGPDFDVHVALMAGICAHSIHNTSRFEIVNRDGQEGPNVMLMLTLNAQLESSPDRHQARLLTIFDQRMKEGFQKSASAKQAVHWTDRFGITGDLRHGSLLACAVLYGSSLYLREAINGNCGSLSFEDCQELLRYAVPPAKVCSDMRAESGLTPFNARAAGMLLQVGADPTHEDDKQRSAWHNVIDLLLHIFGAIELGRRYGLPGILEMAELLAMHAPDKVKLATIEVRGLPASEGIRRRLKGKCCRGKSMMACDCAKAQSWARIAEQVLQLIEPCGTDEHRTTSKRHLFKRFATLGLWRPASSPKLSHPGT